MGLTLSLRLSSTAFLNSGACWAGMLDLRYRVARCGVCSVRVGSVKGGERAAVATVI